MLDLLGVCWWMEGPGACRALPCPREHSRERWPLVGLLRLGHFRRRGEAWPGVGGGALFEGWVCSKGHSTSLSNAQIGAMGHSKGF